MNVTSTGVGIGITPSAKLHVDGDIRIDSGHTLDFESKAYIDVNVNSGTGDDLFYIRRRGSQMKLHLTLQQHLHQSLILRMVH
jgi:hypothetical protein